MSGIARCIRMLNQEIFILLELMNPTLKIIE